MNTLTVSPHCENTSCMKPHTASVQRICHWTMCAILCQPRVRGVLQADLQGYCLLAVLLTADECHSSLVLMSAAFCVGMPEWTSQSCLLPEDESLVWALFALQNQSQHDMYIPHAAACSSNSKHAKAPTTINQGTNSFHMQATCKPHQAEHAHEHHDFLTLCTRHLQRPLPSLYTLAAA